MPALDDRRRAVRVCSCRMQPCVVSAFFLHNVHKCTGGAPADVAPADVAPADGGEPCALQLSAVALCGELVMPTAACAMHISVL